MKILIIEDEELLRINIIAYLKAEGNVCDFAPTFESASQKIALYDYDCILLDLTLPDGDGLALLKEIKKLKKTDGIIIITARNSIDQRIEGLSLGADDYLIKPFHLSELGARIMAIVRRRTFNGNDLLMFNELTIDIQAKEVKVKGEPISLTRKEFDLLVYFVANKSKVISKSAAVTHIWGDNADMADSFDFIYTHIKNLRKKLLDAGSKDYFHSIYGVGYKFTDS
ncbi:response regulator transcription factor [Pedobacter frigiditerrae]|uniref:response regulator transcription factor n=1 Tax=Pedobacter frigiditerrae TaxID=2530452 RepID=UPI002931C1DB|nr:response regulator transcription factor [Pedobacter frigiditerrae]